MSVSIVVTGAAGSLGHRVVRLLAARPEVDRIVGIDVAALERWPDQVERHVLDLAAGPDGADPLVELLDGADGVLHLAWAAPDGSKTATAEANQRALRRVLAAVDAAPTPPTTVVQVSSATVYGAWADNRIPLSEDVPLRPNPGFSYAVEKAEAERRLAEWSAERPGLAVAVLRPAVTVGFGNQPLYDALGGTRAPSAGDGGRLVQFLHVEDLASAVVLAWAERLRGVYNVAPDGGIREDTARALAGGVAQVALPARLVRAIGAWTWYLWRRGLPKEAAAYSVHPWVVAADRLRAAGWSPNFTSEEALVATDVRPHWDDLPPGRRQNYVVLLVVASVVTGVGGVTSAVLAWRGRRRRRS